MSFARVRGVELEYIHVGQPHLLRSVPAVK
jgi:hypothetical protein